MTSTVLRIGCVALGLQCLAALAQDADGSTRAQRDADNPLRLIIEASKLKPRSKGDDADAAAKPTVEAKAAALKTPAARPPPRKLATLPDVVVPDVQPVVAAMPEPMQAMAFVPPAPYDPDDYFGAPPPLKGTAALPPRTLPAAPAASAARAAATNAESRAALQIVDYVEPVLPDRVRQRLHGNGEVVLSFMVDPDGSVRDVAIRSASDKLLEAAAIDAVRQWRYKPIAVAQAHGVQLVFKLGQ